MVYPRVYEFDDLPTTLTVMRPTADLKLISYLASILPAYLKAQSAVIN